MSVTRLAPISIATYVSPAWTVLHDGYAYGQDAANALFHVVNDRHLRKWPMICSELCCILPRAI
jgi:hypothetical protein